MPTEKSKVDTWIDLIKLGVDYRDKVSSINKWPKFRNMYRGKFGAGVSPVNRTFSYGRSLTPRIYFRAPRVTVTASHPDMVWHARVVEALDNILIKEMMLKYTLKASILDGFLCGVSPIKLGYDSEFGYIPDHAALDSGETVTQVGKKGSGRIEYKQYIKPGMPWASRVLPEDIIVPWGTRDQYSMSWVCNYILRPLKDVKNDSKYSNTQDLKGTRVPNPKMGKTNIDIKRYKEGQELAELYEIRDFSEGKIITICEDKTLLEVDDILQTGGLPYEFLMFNPDPEHFWPIPDMAILEPSQDELNEVRSQISRHRKITLLKFLYSKDKIKETDIEAFLSNNIGIAIGVENAEVLANAIHEFTPHIPQELYSDAMSILGEMQESLGFNANQLSQFKAGTPPTATETRGVGQSFDMRTDERTDIVSDVLVNIIQKWNSYIFKLWDEEKVIQITRPSGEPAWIKYTGQELEGNYRLRLNSDNGIPLTQQVKFELSKALYGLFNGDPMVDQMLLRKIMLSYFGQVDPTAEMLLQQPPPTPIPVPGMPTTPEEAAAMRQPGPMMDGKQHGGPRQMMNLNEATKAGGS